MSRGIASSTIETVCADIVSILEKEPEPIPALSIMTIIKSGGLKTTTSCLKRNMSVGRLAYFLKMMRKLGNVDLVEIKGENRWFVCR